MKLLIDISEAEYHLIKKLVASGEGNRQAILILGGTPVYEHERLKGEWKIIEHENHYLMGIYQCNLCSYKYPCPDEFARNYCPNCGADMRGEENG